MARSRLNRRLQVQPAEGQVKQSSYKLPYDALSSAFATFGRLLATRQTLALMATALVICSLLSPAILLTFSPSGSPFDISASAITRRGRGELLWELEGMRRQGLISTEEDVCWDRVKRYYEVTGREGGGRRIRVEQILVSVAGPRGIAGSKGSIGKGVLHRAWRVEKEIERRLLAGEVPGNRCLSVTLRGEKRCAVLSPAAWWKDEDALLQDDDVHRTLSGAVPGANVSKIPLTLSEAFVGIGRDRQGTVKTAQALVLAFFFQDDALLLPPLNTSRTEDILRDEAKAAWRQTVRDVVDSKGWEDEAALQTVDPMGITSESRIAPRHILLKFLPHLVVDAHPRRLENIIYVVGYVLIVLYVSRYIRKLRAHSKMGLLVTGIVELTASGIMSVSICWLLGWSLALVPWNLLAFLVLTSGLDNMILVLRAIASTDMNLPVPQRMSIGLRSVGVEMTILLFVEESMAAALLAFVEIGVMRQWIRFGAVVLVVDFFLELTFFSTVLSIDIQRLELADLLTQASPNQQLSPASSSPNPSSTPDISSASPFRSAAKASWKVLRDRPAKTSTVAFLWFINVLLYAFYGSEHYLPAVCSQTALSSDRPFLAPSLSPAISRSLRIGQTTDPASSSHLEVPLGAGAAFWKLVNPSNTTSVQVYLEPTVSIQFFDDEALAAPESIDLLHSVVNDAGPSLATKVLIVLIPIALVMALLYILLLYLLKDAELLQAHWGSEERLGGPSARRRRSEEKKPDALVEVVGELTAQHRSDVELIASGGRVVASWDGLGEKVQVQVSGGENSGARTTSFHLDIPLGAEPPSLVALAVDGEGGFCAAATAKGRILVWSLERGGGLVDFGSTPAPSFGPIVGLLATPSERKTASSGGETDGPGVAPPLSAASRSKAFQQAPTAFFALHRDGMVSRWDYRACRVDIVRKSSSDSEDPVSKRWLLPGVTALYSPILAVSHRSGRLVLLPLDKLNEHLLDRVVVGSNEPITTVVVGAFPVLAPATIENPISRTVVAVGSSTGAVKLYVVSAPFSSQSIDVAKLGSPIRQIRLCESPPSFCPTCNDSLVDGSILLASTRTSLRIFRIFTPPTPSSLEPCSCNTSDITIIPRSRSSSTGVLGSPAMTRTLSSGGASRRFSPRKKPATPTRPPALGDSPLRPRNASQGTNGSFGSQASSSGNTSPGVDRTYFALTPASPPPPPPLSTSPSSHSLSSAEISPLPSTVPLPPPLVSPSSASSTDLTGPFLRASEVASGTVDERSGWEVIDGKAVGLRRARRMDGGRGWEVWSISLGKEGGAFTDGYDEGATELAELLSAAAEVDENEGSSFSAANGSTSSSSLRRRNPPTSATSSRPRPPSSASPSSYPPSSLPPSTIRFSPETVDLPFSRARPLVPALAGSALAVGIGSQVVVLRGSKGGAGAAGAAGFLGL